MGCLRLIEAKSLKNIVKLLDRDNIELYNF